MLHLSFRRRCLALGALLWFAIPAFAQESWVGETIITKKAGIKIGYTGGDGRQVYVGELTRLDYKVLADEGGWLKVNNGQGAEGWFDKTDAVLLKDALSYFTGKIQQNPKDADAFNCRSFVWRLKGELDIAIKDLSEAIRLQPTDGNYYNARGIVWLEKKEYERAIRDYDEAIRLDPKDLFAYYNRGGAWEKQRKFAKAIADYSQVIRLDPTYSYAHNARAWIWATCPDARFRNGKRAVESAKKAMQLYPHGGNKDTLAAAYAELGNFEEAVRWQEAALADADFRNNEDFRRRLELYRNKKPYREQ
jgi:tetratricopeptide (TPR) repeat protein